MTGAPHTTGASATAGTTSAGHPGPQPSAAGGDADPSPIGRALTLTWIVVLAVTAGLTGLILLDRLTPLQLWAPVPPIFGTEISPRIAQPLGYWNSVGLWCSLTLALLIAAAQLPWRRAPLLAGTAIPLVVATGFLTYSRGFVLTAIVATGAVVWLASDRARAALTVLLTAGPSAVAIWAVAADGDVAHGTESVGVKALAGLVLASAAGALLLTRVSLPAGRLRSAAAHWRAMPPSGGLRRSARVVAMLVAAGLAVLLAVAFVRGLQQPYASGNDIRDRYGDLSNNGRFLLWKAALNEWKEHPLRGTGPDTFRFTFDRVAPSGFTARDAHSAPVERLTERGPLGLLGYVAFVAAATLLLIASLRASRGSLAARQLAAGCAAALAAIWVATLYDWHWEIPAMRALTYGLIAAAAVPLATAAGRARRVAAAAWVLVALLLAAGAAQLRPSPLAQALHDSRAAVRAGDLSSAQKHAHRAVDVAPSSPDGYAQLALIAERVGDYTAAAATLQQGIARQPGDWRLHVLLARIYAEAGLPGPAYAELASGERARPNGQFFAAKVAAPKDGARRACTGGTELEYEHCERLPRADGSWELPGDSGSPGALPLPPLTASVLVSDAASPAAQQRAQARVLARLLEARPAPGG